MASCGVLVSATPGSDNTLAIYENQMVGVALRGYGWI
jgi:hypothetical protein